MHPLRNQLDAARSGALVQRAPWLGTLVVTGPDGKTWLNGLVTQNLAPLEKGQGAFGLSVAKNGKIQAELSIVIDDDRLLVSAPREQVAELCEGLDRYLIMEDAAVADGSAEHAWILVYGPLAGELVRVARGAGASAALVDRTGLGGAAIVCAQTNEAELVERLLAAAGDKGAEATAEGFAQLLLEEGRGAWGVDYDELCYPQEASIEDLAVSFDKGCYLGQEAVFMLQVRGHVKQKLVPITIDGEGDVAKGTPIESPAGDAVGRVTSAGKHSVSGATIAIAMVKYKHAQPGVELRVDGRVAKVRER